MKSEPVFDQPVFGGHCPEDVELFFLLDKTTALQESFLEAKDYNPLRPSRRFKIVYSPTHSAPGLYALAASIEDALAEVRPKQMLELKAMPDAQQLVAAWASLLRKELTDFGSKRQGEAAQRAAFNLDRDQWIEENGSERLRKAIEHGYKANAVYVLEHAHTEFEALSQNAAGDESSDASQLKLGIVEAGKKRLAINPTLYELQMLEKAIATAQAAGLYAAYPELDIYLTPGARSGVSSLRIDNYLDFYSLQAN